MIGRETILVAIVPLESPVLMNQSSKAVYPLAIANCNDSNKLRCKCSVVELIYLIFRNNWYWGNVDDIHCYM